MWTRVKAVVRASDLIIALVAVIALMLAACTGESSTSRPPEAAPTTTTVDSSASQNSDQDLVFGKGQLPETIPADFPIPDQAVIGSTMVDRTRDLTEVIVTYPADVPEVVEFFESNLPALGYSVDTSSGTDARWIIEFSSDGSTGELVLSVGGTGLTQSTLSIVTPVAG